MGEFDEESLKRLIRVMNSVLNLYDIEKIPVEIIDMLYTPVGELAKILNITVKPRPGTNEIDKFIMPENFERWLETNGRLQT